MNCELRKLREQIDIEDSLILSHLSARIAIAKQIRAVKKRIGAPHPDLNRESQLLGDIRQRARACGLHEDHAVKVFKAIISLTKYEQAKYIRGKNTVVDGVNTE